MASYEQTRNEIGLPTRAFLYTLDQIGTMVGLDEKQIALNYIYFDRRTPGVRSRDKMKAVNIAAPDDDPEWRVAEKELIRWLKYKGFRVVIRGFANS